MCGEDINLCSARGVLVENANLSIWKSAMTRTSTRLIHSHDGVTQPDFLLRALALTLGGTNFRAASDLSSSSTSLAELASGFADCSDPLLLVEVVLCRAVGLDLPVCSVSSIVLPGPEAFR